MMETIFRQDQKSWYLYYGGIKGKRCDVRGSILQRNGNFKKSVRWVRAIDGEVYGWRGGRCGTSITMSSER